jgi:hypothetical protein
VRLGAADLPEGDAAPRNSTTFEYETTHRSAELQNGEAATCRQVGLQGDAEPAPELRCMPLPHHLGLEVITRALIR